MTRYFDFDSFDEAVSFSEKAGFQLSDLQKQDVNTLVSWGRGLLQYEVGGGKTVVSTAVSMMLDHEVTIVTVLPVLVTPWVNWLRQVSGNVVDYRGTREDRKGLSLRTARWIVCTHDLFRRDFLYLVKALQGREYDIIMDEAHKAKNAESILYKRLLMLAPPGVCVQQLTGTPTSKPDDAYSYIKLNSPVQHYRDFSHFEAIHVADRDFYSRVTEWKHLDLLAERLAERSIKRSKLEIHGYDNPPNSPDMSYELDADHYALYLKLISEQILVLADKKIDASTPQRLYYMTQQIIANWGEFSGDPSNRARIYDILDMVIEQVEPDNQNNSKLILWTNYKMTTRGVLSYLLGKGKAAVAAYSGSNAEKATQLFMHDPNTRYLVAQYQSAGAGLNPQKVCWESLHMEFNTVPLFMRQAIGRIDRMGQEHVPTVRVPRAVNTVQDALFYDLLNKSDLVDRVELTPEGLRGILLGQTPGPIPTTFRLEGA